MSRLHISVTQEDIDKGLPMVAACCPVARAIQRVTGDSSWRVGPMRISPAGPVYYDTPREVSKFVVAFDRHLPVSPFEFDLDVDDAAVAL